MFKRRNEGFTLVELLIVLAVIAALLAIVTPVAVNAVRRAKATQVASTLRNIAAAVQQYYYTEEKMATSVASLRSAKYIQGKVDDYKLSSATNTISAPATTDTVAYVIYDVAITDPNQRNSMQNVWSEIGFANNKPYVKVEVSRYW